MVLNLIQKLCFSILLLLPILTAYRPPLESSYNDETHTDKNPSDTSLISDTSTIDSQYTNQTDSNFPFFSFSQLDIVLIISISVYLLYLVYKRRLTFQSALRLLAERFPRLTPLLIIAHLVHQDIVSRSDDPEQVVTQHHPEHNSSSDVNQQQTQLMTVDTIETINESSDNANIRHEHNNESTEKEVWYDCRPYTLAQEEECQQHLVANLHSNAVSEEPQPSCSLEE